MLELLFTGLYIGSIHIFTSPDHLAALIPLSLMDSKKSWRVGLLWGFGHLIGLLLLGILLYYFKSLINIDAFSHYSLLYIGILLILIGIWVVVKSGRIKLKPSPKTHKHLSRISIGTGVVHGFAGFSHIYSLAPTISMNDTDFFSYFGGFAFGSIASVVLFTYLLCFIPTRITSKEQLYQKICKWSGIVSIALGVLIVIFFLSGTHDALGHHH
ncbi:hypothetical protein C7377_1537 [Balneicella halophila]|uniref:Cytochrome C biogenesis DsbD-like protein n=1 Tax=Balneicella halophila TaxID=1537566 RepID=A0A7L4UMY9_BALHA|nr:hypothetical protein [Balneicella halophila]PVX49899.1 hypothetical protein C7377_1537 [Balneicella halophila]